jgi:glutamate racemase
MSSLNAKSSNPDSQLPFSNDFEAIGVFDSGLGGLTVLKSLIEAFPNENFIYLGDTARLPYGSKSKETIREYATQILDYLTRIAKLKAIVVACNSASTQVPETHWQSIPVLTVIEPGVKLALSKTKSRRVGLMATRATVLSDEYGKTLRRLNPEAQLIANPCPLLVPLAEEGWIDDPITNLVVYRYVQPLLRENIDTLILGCTHYPILEASIRKAVGTGIELIHSGPAIVQDLKSRLSTPFTKFQSTTPARLHLLTTDFNPVVQAQAERLLSPLKINSFTWI